MSNDSKSPILMYTTNWCPDCTRAKSFLDSKGIAYTEIDIEQDAEAATLVIEKNEGRRRVPTLLINGEYHGDPGVAKIAELVGVPLW